MLLILHVVMKTLDKTCCHVYIYSKCLYDNITTLVRIMDKEQALKQLNDALADMSAVFSDSPAFGFGILTGKASVFLELGLIDLDQYNDFGNRGSDLYRSLFEAL